MIASSLAQSIGLGLAGRGDVSDAVAWAEQARRAGLDSVWVHDSLFERDAVSYVSAIAARVPDVRLGLGALSVYTRHPALIAMTVSAIDDLAPGRVVLGLGTGLPLRLGQLGIPYAPDQAIDDVGHAIDVLRALWAGERVPAPPGLPPVQPMFPPVHHVPIYVAAYRSAFMPLVGAKADGYLARPAESLPSLRGLVAKIRAASVAAGRPERAVNVAGYLLCYVDRTRREAVNRAKREPFVIYMLGIQSDVAMRRVGIDPALRDRVAAAWRAEDYHTAAELIPDDLLDAFLLCGTREEVAERAWAYREAGMDLPIVQPVVQEQEQVQAVIDAAVIYGTQVRTAPAAHAPGRERPLVVEVVGPEHVPAPGLRRRLGAWGEILRPFSFTASIVPVLSGGALAAARHEFSWPLFLAALLGGVALQAGTNVINEIYDVRTGVDTIVSPRASQALLKGRIREREAFVLAGLLFLVAALVGAGLVLVRGLPVVVLGLLGLLGGWGYTAPPLQYKYRALGLPLVFLLMGPLMVAGTSFVVSGSFDPASLVVSLPVGLLVTAILHGNEWRDIGDDARAGIRTFSVAAGRRAAHAGYLGLVAGAYLVLGLGVAVGALPPASLLAMLSMPLLVRAIRSSELGAAGQARAIARIDLETAQLHAVFGVLFALGLALAAVVR